MENDTHEEKLAENTFIVKEGKTTEDFQKFFYELFEKNGVLNDLRAYLRGHIINILKSIDKGETPMCQKHFMQRLEVSYQAINMLVAEYLMCMDFTYSLSVFISEIPLVNMVFDFAKSLLRFKSENPSEQLRFKDEDVWRILNYIGVKCDSDSAANIVNMYRKEESPLLLCILKCVSLYKHQLEYPGEGSNLQASASSNSSLSEEPCLNNATKSETLSCKHINFCYTCKQKIKGFRMEYKKKKRRLKKDAKASDANLVNVQNFLRDVDVTERSIIEQMFEQLKKVYETEVDMVREEEERKVKRSLANHELLLQKRYDEMEGSFKAREAELECSVQQKKKFLWGLARALREQHSNMSDAMKAVQKETERLNVKEDNLKHQISEAELTLKRKGEEMREQISTELIILDGRLNSMRRERDEIDRERSELDKLKEICSTSTKLAIDNIKEREILSTKYDLLKEELVALKKSLTVPRREKCFIERAVMTDAKFRPNSMNNEQEMEKMVKSDDCIRTPNQLVNDLKKKKNVNFNSENLEEIIPDRNRERHLEILLQENERLKAFADQQHRHIEQLARDHMLLRSQLGSVGMAGTVALRPRTAPPSMTSPIGAEASAGFEAGCRRGGGEELSPVPASRPLLPGDELPFVGLLPDRRTDRRHLIKQWRSLRRRLATEEALSPQAGTSRQANEGETEIPWPIQSQVVMPVNVVVEKPRRDKDGGIQHQPQVAAELKKNRVKSPKSVLREAKQKLRNKDRGKRQPDVIRDKSPNTMLKEAKLRLRKLEIEAEAVERSYLDFRRRQSQMTNDDVKGKGSLATLDKTSQSLDDKQSSSFQKRNKERTETSEHNLHSKATHDILTNDFEIYLKEYQSKQNVTESHINIKNIRSDKMKPIPSTYLKLTEELERARRSVNYLETPLREFRKLYHNGKPRQLHSENIELKSDTSITRGVKDRKQTHSETDIDNIMHTKDVEEDNITLYKEDLEEASSKELKILKKHTSEISKPSSSQILTTEEILQLTELDKENQLKTEDPHKNLLKIEIENVTETKNVKVNEKDDISIIVQSSIDAGVLKATKNNIITVVISPKENSQHSPNIKIDDVPNEDKTKDKSQDASPKSLSNASKSSKNVILKTPDSETKENHEISKKPSGHEENFTENNNFNEILDTKANEGSDIEIDLEHSNNEVNSLIDATKDYPDDFSADVDNYESRSEIENSPISLPKTSEEDNFWD